MATIQSDQRAEGMPRIGDIIDRRFLIEGELGAGGMGIVFAATHIELDQPVAMKFIRADRRTSAAIFERFLREARVCARIDHPNVIKVHDCSRYGDAGAYMVMQRLVGESLGQRIERGGPLPIDLATQVVIQVLEGLHAGHEMGVVHRDVKPDNVFLEGSDAAPVVKVLDFGIAHAARDDGPALTREGAILGTPRYMSPEQAGGEATDRTTDIFSAGATLYHAVTGRPPFPRDSVQAALRAAIRGAFDPPSKLRHDLPASLERIISRAMAPSRGDRFVSAQEFADALRNFAARARTDTSPAPHPEPATSSASWWRIAKRITDVLRTPRAAAILLAIPFAGVATALTRTLATTHDRPPEVRRPERRAPPTALLPSALTSSVGAARTIGATAEARPVRDLSPAAPVEHDATPGGRVVRVTVVTEDEAVVTAPGCGARATARLGDEGNLARATLLVPAGTRRVCCAVPGDRRRPCVPIMVNEEGEGHARCFAD